MVILKLLENEEYLQDISRVTKLSLPWNKLSNKSILISGATGLIGSSLVDTILALNREGLGCKIYALGRNYEKIKDRFNLNESSSFLEFISYNINMPFERNDIQEIDYVLHLASNTHPLQYINDPIGTITTNVFGTYNMLKFAYNHNARRCAIASSNEIYGENRGDVEKFDEAYCGYINSNTLRAGYPESKRCSEALSQAFIAQNDMDIVIPRITRTFGPTMLMTDSKAMSQFIKKGISDQDIVLKSEGNQYYSYTYVTDAVSGLLTVLLKGEKGEAYNIADEIGDITLKNAAEIIAEYVGKKVVFEIPDCQEAAGYSTATKARLDSEKLKLLGWKASINIKDGLEKTVRIMKTLYL